jgi:hypothetical protein
MHDVVGFIEMDEVAIFISWKYVCFVEKIHSEPHSQSWK